MPECGFVRAADVDGRSDRRKLGLKSCDPGLELVARMLEIGKRGSGAGKLS